MQRAPERLLGVGSHFVEAYGHLVTEAVQLPRPHDPGIDSEGVPADIEAGGDAVRLFGIETDAVEPDAAEGNIDGVSKASPPSPFSMRKVKSTGRRVCLLRSIVFSSGILYLPEKKKWIFLLVASHPPPRGRG